MQCHLTSCSSAFYFLCRPALHVVVVYINDSFMSTPLLFIHTIMVIPRFDEHKHGEAGMKLCACDWTD